MAEKRKPGRPAVEKRNGPTRRGPTNRTDHARVRARKAFLKRLAETCNVSEASRAAGIARSTAHDWKAADADFSKQWDEAIEVARDELEAEARRRAVDGWKEPVFQQGKKVGTIQRYDSRLLEILLKAHRPAFRDRVGVDLDANVNVRQEQEKPLAELTDDRERLEWARVHAFLVHKVADEALKAGYTRATEALLDAATALYSDVTGYGRPEPAAPLALPAPPEPPKPEPQPDPEPRPIDGESRRLVQIGDALADEDYLAAYGDPSGGEQGLDMARQRPGVISGRRRKW